ncbi:MAG TPA: hypothetical protein PLJ78_13910 [Anaerolineae bacterium]|nr:hypothetical protein [Anaerolineae bacterium]
MQRIVHAPTVRQAGPADQQRHAADGWVGGLVVAPHVELALAFRVLGADDDDGIVEDAFGRQRIQQLADSPIGIPDAHIVTVNPLPDGSHRIELQRHARILSHPHLIQIVAGQFLARVVHY